MTTRTEGTPEELSPEVLEAIREEARGAVERFSLRVVAGQIGMSHTGLRDFIREGNPRNPQGRTQRALLDWALERGVELPARGALGAPDRKTGKLSLSVPPRAYQLIYEYCRLLEDAEVPEEQIEEARRLMSGETFNTLRAHMLRDRDEAGWVKDVKAAWAFIKDQLISQGFEL